MHPQEHAELRTPSQPAIDDETLLDSNATRARCGGKTNMTLWRWQRDPRVQFPRPDMVINGRRYWRLGTLRRWQAQQANKQAA